MLCEKLKRAITVQVIDAFSINYSFFHYLLKFNFYKKYGV